MNRILPKPTSGPSTKIKVSTLDHFVEGNNVQGIDLIKIDVEGFEMKVLEGGLKTIEKLHPKLFIELRDENLKTQGSSALQLVKWLEDRGYRVTDASSQKVLTSAKNAISNQSDLVGIMTDIVARA
jgi:hypothetical protein